MLVFPIDLYMYYSVSLLALILWQARNIEEYSKTILTRSRNPFPLLEIFFCIVRPRQSRPMKKSPVIDKEKRKEWRGPRIYSRFVRKEANKEKKMKKKENVYIPARAEALRIAVAVKAFLNCIAE